MDATQTHNGRQGDLTVNIATETMVIMVAEI